MISKIRNISNQLRTLALGGILFASAAAAIATPGAASANSILPPPVDGYGVLNVSVLYSSTGVAINDQPATVAVYNEAGEGVAKAQVSGGSTDVAKLPVGNYKVVISQVGYVTQSAPATINADETAKIAFGMRTTSGTSDTGALTVAPESNDLAILNVAVSYPNTVGQVPAATVQVVNEKGTTVLKTLIYGSGMTKAELLPGTYTVNIYADGFKTVTQKVQLTSGAQSDVKVAMQANTSLRTRS